MYSAACRPGVEYTFIKRIIFGLPSALTSLLWLAQPGDDERLLAAFKGKSYRAIDRALRRREARLSALAANETAGERPLLAALRQQWISMVTRRGQAACGIEHRGLACGRWRRPVRRAARGARWAAASVGGAIRAVDRSGGGDPWRRGGLQTSPRSGECVTCNCSKRNTGAGEGL